jgi:tRNA G37 N-methylase Trm5
MLINTPQKTNNNAHVNYFMLLQEMDTRSCNAYRQTSLRIHNVSRFRGEKIRSVSYNFQRKESLMKNSLILTQEESLSMWPIIGCVVLVRPPKELHYTLARDQFYANVYSTYDIIQLFNKGRRQGGKV